MSTSDSTPSLGRLPPDFRRLQRNDTEQTNDQWKLNLLRETGAIAPIWTSYAKSNKIPAVSTTRPREPLKPSDPEIMASMKMDYRVANSIALKTPLEETPEVSAMVIWDQYQSEKAYYENKLALFQREDKEVNELFPQENRKVFAMVERAMSDASIEDVKRTPAGATAYEKQDALCFLRAAMEVHDFVSPSISDQACQRAKKQFENHRQQPGASIPVHLAEFRRLLDHVCKMRGEKVSEVYKDFELKHLLLASLYEPAWSDWIRTCQMTRTMPATFEGVETALREEESARVLSNLKDPFKDTAPMAAHATKASTSSHAGSSSCTTCGITFTPKKAVHVRCETCHKRYAEDKKKKRDPRTSQGPADPRPSRGPTRSVHETEATQREDEHEDDPTPAWASYATMVSALATRTEDTDYIIFDPASNSHVIKDPRLALNPYDNGPVTRIRGSVPGCIEVRTHGSLGDMGAGPISPSFTRSLISESAALAAGYHVVHDTRIANEYHLLKEGRPPLIFKMNREGTYSMPIKEFMSHFPTSYESVNHATDVERSQIVFTKSQRERADLYRRHHATVFAHAHDDRIIAALENGSLIDVPYTAADVKNAAVMHGPCIECLRAKGTKHRQTGHYPRRPSAPGELLTGDLFHIMGVAFFMLTCRMVNLRIVIRLKSKSASQIMAATSSALDIWKGFGATPKIISWDQEPAMVACSNEIWAKHGVKLEFTPPDGHEKVAERNVRTIKEHLYASILTLGHPIDEAMLEGMVRDTVSTLNFLPTTEVDRSAPRTFLDGERLNVARWSRFSAGQVGEFEIPYPDRSTGTRRELGYVLCHQGDNAIVRLLPSGKKAVVRSAHFTPLHKTPAILKLINDGISEANKQDYKDLLAEIGEYYAHSHAHLQVSPQVITVPAITDDSSPTEAHNSEEDINFFASAPEPQAASEDPPRAEDTGHDSNTGDTALQQRPEVTTHG